MTGRPVARPVGHVRRRSAPVRRRSAGLTATRAAALLAMIASAAVAYGLASSPVFGLDRLRIEGGTLTSEEAVRAALGGAAAPRVNLVTLDTSALGGLIERLPTVREADVSVGLPGTLMVRLVDRTAIMTWRAGDRRLLVDIDGRVVEDLSAGEAGPAGTVPGTADPGTVDPGAATQGGAVPTTALPEVVDRRASATALTVGARLDPIDLDAARRLASLRSSDVGSSASSLLVTLDETDGFAVAPVDGGWRAVFGFYTPSQRTTDIIPGQVRLLRSLLAGREDTVGRVVLASATDGTYVPRATPRPSASPRPSRSP